MKNLEEQDIILKGYVLHLNVGVMRWDNGSTSWNTFVISYGCCVRTRILLEFQSQAVSTRWNAFQDLCADQVYPNELHA
jgi:hypothetical protein